MLELIKIRKDIAEIFQQIKCLFAKGTYATAWSENHTLTTGGPYLKNTVVWYQGFIYKAIHNNESELPTNPIYWECIGEGFLLEEKIPNWFSLPGSKTFIKNKPTKTSDFLNDGELGTDPYASQQYVLDRLHQVDVITNTSDLINDGADGIHPFITLEDAPARSLQQTVDIGNSIVLPSNVNKGINITIPNLQEQYSTGIYITVDSQTGTYANSDAFVAKINGQNPGSLPYFVGGFSVITTGADNYSFISEHLAGTTSSVHFRGSNYLGVSDEFIKFTTNNIDAFNVDYLGNTIGNTFVKRGGLSSQFLKADGSVDSNIYLTSLTGVELLSNKQNNLSVDGTGVMYPTVDAVNDKVSNIDNTSDIDKPVSTAQATANNVILSTANAYTDSRISGVYKVKGNVANYASLPSSGQVIGDVWNTLDTGDNYVWVGTLWDKLGATVDISGKEDSTNKQNNLSVDGTGIKYVTVDAVNLGLSNKVDKITGSRLITTAESIILSNTSNINTGDQILPTLLSLGAAPLLSPSLTGVPTAPTATAGTNTTQIATTAFVLANADGNWTKTGNNIQNNNTGIVTVNNSSSGGGGYNIALQTPTGLFNVTNNGNIVGAYISGNNISAGGAGMYNGGNFSMPAGRIILPYSERSSDFTIGNSYFENCTSGTFTATLPEVTLINLSIRSGLTFKIKNSGTGVITIATTSSQLIDGASTYQLTSGKFIELVANSTTLSWIITSEKNTLGATNLSITSSSTNVIINSSTGTGATIALGNGINAGVTSNDYTTIEKNKVSNLSGTNTGDNATNTNYVSDYRVSNFVAGINYLTPTGSAAGLTSFPTLNQNTTGYASQALTAPSSTNSDLPLTYSDLYNGLPTSLHGQSNVTVNPVTATLKASSFVKTGGTGSQFLKADGSSDSTSYQTALINPITGTGTTNFLPKFTGSSALGNSIVQDNGTNVGIGTIDTTNKLSISDTTLAGSGALAGSALNIVQTWNTTGTPTAFSVNVTNTASNVESALIQAFSNGSSRFRVRQDGNIYATGLQLVGNILTISNYINAVGYNGAYIKTVSNNQTLGIQVQSFSSVSTATSFQPTSTHTVGSFSAISINPIYNQVGSTSSNTDILLNRTTTAVGSGTQLLMDLQNNASSKFSVTPNGEILVNTATNNGIDKLQVNGSIKSTSSVTASSHITSGGTSSQFVKGDGSLDSSTYLTSVGIVNLTATGTPSSTTYLRGDNTWATISAGGTGTVTNVSAITIGTTGIDVSSTVANPTTTPVITLNIPTASATNRGALSSTDWSIFNGKQNAITSSALTKTDDTNITLTLGGTPSTSLLQAVSLTLGWTGTLADARITSAATWNAKEPAIASGTTSQYWRGDKTWQTFPTIPTVGTWGALNYPTYVSGTPFVKMTAAGIFALDTNTYLTSIPAQSFASLTGKPTTLLGYGITDAYPLSGNPSGFISTVNGTSITPSSTNGVSSTVMAYNDATSSIQTQLNSKQATITLTTTGTSGAATFVGNTLNIPQYSSGGGSGTVTSVSVVTANGFAGTVATNTTTPAITISTTITGLIKGNGTSISAATAGTDYLTSVGISNLTATGTPSSTTYLRGDNTWATVAGGGSPGGSTTQIQYNNSGAFAGASKTFIDANGNIVHALDSSPLTPSSGNITEINTSVGGRNMLGIVDSTGINNILQPHIAKNNITLWSAINASTTLQFINTATLTATGTATAASKAVTNIQTRIRRMEYLVTTAATTAVAGFRGAQLEWWLGNAAGSGGFHYVCRFGPATGTATTTSRLFVGMSNTAVGTAPTDVNPSTLLQMFGIGWDSADTNIQFMNNAALVTATKTDLGASFPIPRVDRTSMYELAIFVSPNSTTITYSFTNLGTGAIATGTATSNIPAVNTLLAPRGYMSVGGTSSVIGIALSSLYIETIY